MCSAHIELIIRAHTITVNNFYEIYCKWDQKGIIYNVQKATKSKSGEGERKGKKQINKVATCNGNRQQQAARKKWKIND